jgi:hypothetical protein
LIALHALATVLKDVLETFENAARQSAKHLEMSEQWGGAMKSWKRTVFIGHGRSPVWLELQNFST